MVIGIMSPLSFGPGESVSLIIDGVVDQQAEARGTVPKQIAICERDLLIGAGYRGGQEQTAFHYEGLLHDVRIYRGAIDNIGALSVIPGDVRDSLALPRDERTDKQSRQLDEFYESIDPVRLQTRFRIADLKRKISELDPLGEVAQVMQEMETPRETFVHERGNYKAPGERVTPGVPARFARHRRRRTAQPSRIRPVAGFGRASAHGAGDGQPHLAT